MDAESRHSSHDSRSVNNVDGSSIPRSGQLESQCILCRRAFSLETESNEGSEVICICRVCKFIVLDGNEASITTRDYHRRRRQRGRSRYESSESIEDPFSQQFSQLISLVRQNPEAHDGDTAITMQHHANYNAVRRWQRTFSDNDSESLYLTDSLFGESDSNISFGGYGAESDASLDGHSLLDREMLIQLDNDSRTLTDSDLDPMHAGLDQWNSDGIWEEADIDDPIELAERHELIQDVTYSPIGSGEREAQGGAWISWRLGGSRSDRYTDIYARLDESGPYVGHPGDYLDARGFEELLDQLAEAGSSRRWPPPAAESVVVELPRVVISDDHEKNGVLVCAVCKDPLPVNTEAKQLPCMHLYHSSCILPWLSARNSCPVCRFELPTDDPEYEDGKRRINGDASRGIRQPELAGESSTDASSDSEADEVRDSSDGRIGRGDDDDRVDRIARRSEGGARRWLFLAAAPIVSIVGVALALWFRNPRCNTRGPNQQLQRARGAMAAVGNR